MQKQLHRVLTHDLNVALGFSYTVERMASVSASVRLFHWIDQKEVLAASVRDTQTSGVIYTGIDKES